MSDTLTIEKEKTTIHLGDPHNVILFNDAVHSFDEVIGQIIEAIKCDIKKAEAFANKAHAEGKVIVFTGTLERCELVDSILGASPVNLRTQIE